MILQLLLQQQQQQQVQQQLRLAPEATISGPLVPDSGQRMSSGVCDIWRPPATHLPLLFGQGCCDSSLSWRVNKTSLTGRNKYQSNERFESEVVLSTKRPPPPLYVGVAARHLIGDGRFSSSLATHASGFN